MAPRRSARVSAITQQAALEKNNVLKQQPPKKEKKTSQNNGVTKNKSTKATPTQTGGKGRKVSTSKATAAVLVPSTADSEAFKIPDIPPVSTPKRARPNSTNTGIDAGNPNHPAPPLDRPIDPHLTNAILRTPRGSHLTAYPVEKPSDAATLSPSKCSGRLPRPTTTTGTVLEEAVAHLITVAPQLKPVIDKHPCPLFSPAGLAEEIDPFNALVSGIIGQQVSGAAAKSIKRRFLGLFGCLDCNGNAEASNNGVNATEKGVGEEKERAEMRYDRDDHFPTPAQVAACGVATLRTAGLSQRKAEYIQGLAEKFASGELSAHMLLQASDEEVLEKLIAVRGLGRWSVEMFECFGLKRMDVFSTGDLGVQRGMATFVGRDVSKLKTKGSGKFKYMSEKEMLEIAAPFSPYRSLLMWYMWRIENVDISIMQ
ncbi:DNA-3-methyladenine glycosylase II [Paracoccidioides brasiliensis Pb18]|uniref:HhH-GPD domain-containing protein n=2 Tax=Paracoccidioides brasiliensis TaxID=121759 RepID=C1GBX8_PARBD|nr:DNA-3-methyladenine glycosylase II [Paracoccidioides brasiliensis Pb18]EEH48421.1 hypothetical protein PADG_04500 [Paracoccidioides brasiliensis Pb18]ODH50060.1 hypothetical protein GX48_03865 [Paracoccidioides brasiliensis]